MTDNSNNANGTTGSVQFIQYHLPTLTEGRYRLTVEQRILTQRTARYRTRLFRSWFRIS